MKLLFDDGEIVISVFVTNVKDEGESDEKTDNSTDKEPDVKPDEVNIPNTDEGNAPKTGDSYPITVLAVIAAALFVIVVSSRKRTGKTY